MALMKNEWTEGSRAKDISLYIGDVRCATVYCIQRGGSLMAHYWELLAAARKMSLRSWDTQRRVSRAIQRRVELHKGPVGGNVVVAAPAYISSQ